MGWEIRCVNGCGRGAWGVNIADLLENHRDERGFFLCSCGGSGYIQKAYDLQETGQVWEPLLRGALLLGEEGDTYQPFVFLVSYQPEADISDVWYCYYKDTRATGGRLKLGYGPGGPPVLGKSQVLDLMGKLLELGYFSGEEIAKVAESAKA